MSHDQLTITAAGAHYEVRFASRASGTCHGQFVTTATAQRIAAVGDQILAILDRQWQRDGSPLDLDDLKAAGEQLGRLLLGDDLLAAIARRRPTTLLINLPVTVRRVPVELMVVEGQFLGRITGVGRNVDLGTGSAPVSSTNAVRSLSVPSKGGIRVRLLADPTFELRHAHIEARLVSDLWFGRRDALQISTFSPQTSVVTRGDALRALAEADWLHLCGHAEDELETGVRAWGFHDGLLTVDELMSAGLKKVPSFVFVNACGSAAAPLDDAKRTLVDQLMLQGCQQFVGTLKPIRDRDCLPFVAAFYRSVLAGHSTGEAMRQARQALIAEIGETNLLWAVFELRGDPAEALLPGDAGALAMQRVADPPAGNPLLKLLPSGENGQTAMLIHNDAELPGSCAVCHSPIHTRHGIGRREEQAADIRLICRRCHRETRSTAVGRSVPAVEASQPGPSRRAVLKIEKSSSVGACLTEPTVVESEKPSHQDRIGPLPMDEPSSAHRERVKLWFERFMGQWLHAVERFDRYVDPVSGKSISVTLHVAPVVPQSHRLAKKDEDLTAAIAAHGVSLAVNAKERKQRSNPLPTMLWRVVDSATAMGDATDVQEPAGLAQVFESLERFPSANSKNEQVVCLASFNGWSDSAREYVEGTTAGSYFHGHRSLVLFDLRDEVSHARRNDLRVRPWLPLLDLEDENQKIAKVCESIAKRLPLEVSLGATQLAEDVGESEPVTVKAMSKAAAEFGLHLDYLDSFGWVLS